MLFKQKVCSAKLSKVSKSAVDCAGLTVNRGGNRRGRVKINGFKSNVIDQRKATLKTRSCKVRQMFALFALCIALASAQAFPARPATGVVDETRSLSSNDLAALEALLSDARSQGEDIGVVVVNTLDGAQPRAYATELFNAWGLGQAKSNRGVLVLVAVQDRAAELILGAGIDGPDQQDISERIMTETMVPQFRAGRYAMGAFRGAERAAAEILLLPTSVKSAEVNGLNEPDVPENATSFAPATSDAASREPEPQSRPSQDQATTESPSTAKSFWAAVVALPLLALGAGATVWSWLRRRVRSCGLCHRPMQRLSEADDDQHLSPSERVEESVRSVDYDVWRCTACQHAEKLKHRSWFSSYKDCPACKAKTINCLNNVVSEATYTTKGVGKITEHCQACQYHSEKAYVIALRVAPSTNTSNRSANRASSGGSSSRRGGSSRGGGASGRW